MNEAFKPIQQSNYYRYLKKYWLKHFKMHQIHFVNGDNLGKKNPGPEMELVQQFLGVRVLIDSSSFKFVKEKGFYCPVAGRNRQPQCMSSSKGRKHPDQSMETIQKLKQYYHKYNQRLFRQIGRDFGWE